MGSAHLLAELSDLRSKGINAQVTFGGGHMYVTMDRYESPCIIRGRKSPGIELLDDTNNVADLIDDQEVSNNFRNNTYDHNDILVFCVPHNKRCHIPKDWAEMAAVGVSLKVPFKDLIGVIHVLDPRPEKNGEELKLTTGGPILFSLLHASIMLKFFLRILNVLPPFSAYKASLKPF
ncbi:putative phosphoglycerate mutase (2,3-diphosphoglycerate-independent) [Helianthus annuus]|nr:putative phosphoglycerate mutase (2,3-diphosphoglycerate-independent) [Helianthus annuus]